MRPSSLHQAVLFLGVLLAATVLIQLPIEPITISVGLVLITLFGLIECRRALFRNRTSVVAFALFRPKDNAPAAADGAAEREALSINVALQADQHARSAATGTIRSGRVHRGSVVTPWFVSVLYWHDGDATWRQHWPRLIAVWPDSLSREDFRRLRVLLKWA